MPIAFAPSNRELEVRKIGAEDKIKKHLQELGITVSGADSSVQICTAATKI